MSTRRPRSYDDIVRATVPDLDLSWRPTAEQERQAFQGYRAMGPGEQELFDRVHDALVAAGCDVSRIEVDIEHDRVILRGQACGSGALVRIPEIVRAVDGVRSVTDHLVLGAD